MKTIHDWYTFGWQAGSSNAKSSQSSDHLADSTSWYELGWRSAMNADLSLSQQPSSLGRTLRNCWQFITQSLSSNMFMPSEPQVWEADPTKGLLSVRDPRTGRTLYNATEEEVRIWLEERYNA